MPSDRRAAAGRRQHAAADDGHDQPRARRRADGGRDAPAATHTLVNPTGFALEAYDSIGAWQTTEKGTSAAINTRGRRAIGAKKVHVTGPADLMEQIAASPEAQRCYAQKWVQYAYERVLTDQDACTVQTLAAKMATRGYTLIAT